VNDASGIRNLYLNLIGNNSAWSKLRTDFIYAFRVKITKANVGDIPFQLKALKVI
jgi:hypothetical protein